MAAIIERSELPEDRPTVTYRSAGDRYVLVEYGAEATVDLCANFFVHAVARRIAACPIPGVAETAPGLRSLLVRFSPRQTSQSAVVEALEAVHHEVPPPSSLTVPSRRIVLPIAFDDSTSREAIHRYLITVRPDAPNVVNGNNVDYVARYNGFADREALYSTILRTEWWNAFTGFYPGLPSLLPMDPRCKVAAPKYNPARTWTAEGAVGLGGPCIVIHPLETPGSYQLLGRTLPITDLFRNERSRLLDPVLFLFGDRVRFERVEESELIELRRQVFEGTYEYRIEVGQYSIAEHLAEVSRVSDEVRSRHLELTAAMREVKVP
ncbi:carboxyltransferase domain-containing protein [Streptomyces ochraceiscleroticus]|uniref:Carboxyltransferase domain-containing protein n=1 Tax=Streptomyces ochraceiscleroticus TaxID=47761 RepID=A0ABW1MS83_9ACTN|nr:carboxyltransferase domain-containing protein [Streptomyces ochraceiscleroticus]